MSVVPPCSHQMTWWASHQAPRAVSQPFQRQCWSRSSRTFHSGRGHGRGSAPVVQDGGLAPARGPGTGRCHTESRPAVTPSTGYPSAVRASPMAYPVPSAAGTMSNTRFRWGRCRWPWGTAFWWSRSNRQMSPEGVGPALGRDPDGFALGVGGGLHGDPQHRGQQQFARGGLRSPSTRARPAKVRDACNDDGALGAGSGPSRWARHARIAAATSATLNGSSTRDDCVLVPGEHLDAEVWVEKRADGLDLPGGQPPVSPRRRGHRQVGREPRHPSHDRGPGARHAALVRGPHGHRRRPHRIPQ